MLQHRVYSIPQHNTQLLRNTAYTTEHRDTKTIALAKVAEDIKTYSIYPTCYSFSVQLLQKTGVNAVICDLKEAYSVPVSQAA